MSRSASQHFSYQRYTMIHRSIVILFIACTSFVLKAQNSDTLACAERGTLDITSLPATMRFIVHRVGERTLYLHNPHDGTETPIPNTNGLHDYWDFPAFPLLYDEGTQLLVARSIVGNRTLLQVMNLDGSAGATVGESAGIPQPLNDDRILSGQDIIDLHTFGFQHLELPELQGESDLTFEWFSPSGDRLAYYADDVSYGISSVARIYHFETSEYIDIDLTQWIEEPRPTIRWHNHPSLITVYPFNSELQGQPDPTAYVYDSMSGELIYAVHQATVITIYAPLEIAWSLTNERLAVRYRTLDSRQQIIGIQEPDSDVLMRCFALEIQPANPLLNDIGTTIFWTPDSQFVWWLECKVQCNELTDSDTQVDYDLLLANVETGEFGVALSNIGLYTRVGFGDE